MPRIHNATLTVDPVPGHANHRLLHLSYDVDLGEGEGEGDAELPFDEEVTVVSVDTHDAPVHPRALRVELAAGTVSIGAGGERRQHSRAVPRVDLDVNGDWWDTGQSGETRPIAEFADHLIGQVRLLRNGEEIATAETAVVTGSWGALGTS